MLMTTVTVVVEKRVFVARNEDKWTKRIEAQMQLAGLELTMVSPVIIYADLREIRADLWSVLSVVTKEEVGMLREALVAGRINSASDPTCSTSLVGTLADAFGCDPWILFPQEILQEDRPSELFFRGITEGDTPETNPIAQIALNWIDKWLDKQTQ
jgi:hypothetical protein